MVKLLSHRWRITISDTGLPWAIQSVCSKFFFYIFWGRDLSNGKSLMINPQSHSAHYFCHLHKCSAHKVQKSHGITLRNYEKTPTVFVYSTVILRRKMAPPYRDENWYCGGKLQPVKNWYYGGKWRHPIATKIDISAEYCVLEKIDITAENGTTLSRRKLILWRKIVDCKNWYYGVNGTALPWQKLVLA